MGPKLKLIGPGSVARSHRPLIGSFCTSHLVVPILDVRPVPVPAAGGLQVEILRPQPGKEIGRRIDVVAGHHPFAVIHHVVEIDANPEPVRRLDHLQQFRLRAVLRGDGAVLVLVPQIKRIEKIIAHRQRAAALGGLGQPEAGVAGLGQFGHLLGQVGPLHLEQLEHRLAAGAGQTRERKQQADNSTIRRDKKVWFS